MVVPWQFRWDRDVGVVGQMGGQVHPVGKLDKM